MQPSKTLLCSNYIFPHLKNSLQYFSLTVAADADLLGRCCWPKTNMKSCSPGRIPVPVSVSV